MSSFRTTIALLAVLAIGTFAGTSLAGDDHGKAGGDSHADKAKTVEFPKCPVMGDPVDFSVKTATKDGPVYFCCPKCVKKYKANPRKYAKAVAAQRKAVAALPKVQVACPLSGEEIDPKVFTQFNGKKVYFCCEKCIYKFKKDPAKYKDKLDASYTFQTRCPVSGEEIDPTAVLKTADGQKVFFCCPKCKKKFLKNPDKYLSKLEDQGTYLDADQIKIAAKQKTGKKSGHGGTDADHEHH